MGLVLIFFLLGLFMTNPSVARVHETKAEIYQRTHFWSESILFHELLLCITRYTQERMIFLLHPTLLTAVQFFTNFMDLFLLITKYFFKRFIRLILWSVRYAHMRTTLSNDLQHERIMVETCLNLSFMGCNCGLVKIIINKVLKNNMRNENGHMGRKFMGTKCFLTNIFP